MQNKGKTEFLIKYFGINTFSNRSCVGFNDESITLYSASLSDESKKVIVVDFNGDCLNKNVEYRLILEVFMKNASLIFFHLQANEIEGLQTKRYINWI